MRKSRNDFIKQSNVELLELKDLDHFVRCTGNQQKTLRVIIGGFCLSGGPCQPLRIWSPFFSTILSALNFAVIGSLVKGLMSTCF